MDCAFCGCEPADPTTLRPVRPVEGFSSLTVEGMTGATLLEAEYAACEDCYPEVSEAERLWRLRHECGDCWSSPCRCTPSRPLLMLVEVPTCRNCGMELVPAKTGRDTLCANCEANARSGVRHIIGGGWRM